MKVLQLSTKSCETIYQVGDNRVRLFIVTGGTPALSFDDHTFTERFPMWDMRWNVEQEEWGKRECYPHQNPGSSIQGPTFDVLPEGRKTLEDFVGRNAPKLALRVERYANLPVPPKMLHPDAFSRHGKQIVSKRIRDADEGTFVNFEAQLCPYRFGLVTCSSKYYAGRCEDKVEKLAPSWWKKFNAFAAPICDASRDCYDKLTETEYQQLCDLLKEGVATKAFVAKKPTA